MKRPKVKLIGENDNAFYILGMCQRAAKKAKWTEEEWKKVHAEMKSGDYDNLLRVVTEYFDVV